MKNFLPILFCLLSLLAFKAQGQNEFITTWQTTDTEITIPTTGSGYNYDISWTNLDNAGVGDGSASGITGDYTITGLTNDETYEIVISGTFPRIYFNGGVEKDKILTVKQWGIIQWSSMERAFQGCTNFNITATDTPDLSTVTSMRSMFQSCTSLDADLSSWDVSNVEDFLATFSSTQNYSQDLTSWVVTSATNMALMFSNSNFNGSLFGWDVSGVTNFSSMFSASSFNNSSIVSWTTTSATKMDYMFSANTTFNQDISGWNTSLVENMSHMFNNASSFNHSLNSWNVSNVTDMSRMFAFATSFNGDISSWNTTKVTDLSGIFYGATNFNQSIAYNSGTNAWNTSNVTDLSNTFHDATAFNQDISGWDVSKVTSFSSTFEDATSFNQDISGWDVSSVTSMNYTFNGASSFNQNLGSWDISNLFGSNGMYRAFYGSALSTENYDNTLNGWTDGSITPPGYINMYVYGLTYCDASGRDILQNTYNWNFSGDQQSCAPTAISLTSNSIDENNAIGTQIGELVATDSDAGENFTFTFVVGAGDTDNASFTIDKGAISQRSFLRAGEVFDFQTQSSYSVRIQVEDKDGNTYQQQLSITINDVAEINPATAFITTWETTSPSESITIPTNSSETYNYAVDWGDGNIESGLTGDASHTYASAGTYTVSISGDFPRIYFRKIQDGVEDKIFTIQQWGDIEWTSMHEAFQGCSNLNITASDSPNLSNVTDMSSMFVACLSLDADIGDWDVSNVENMNNLFFRAESFNADISGWNVSNVTDMSSMFSSAEIFNQNIGSWQVGNVVDMNSMFSRAHSFNQNIEGWDVSQVTDMSFMFLDAYAFNQPLNAWEVMNVTDMRSMFKKDDFFASESSSFNQPLNSWDVSQVSDMNSMFSGAEVFDQNIDNWQVQNVTDMSQMFYKASAFNQDISTWDFSNVTNMDQMFQSATSFDQAIGSWVINNVVSMDDMLVGSGLSIANYDATLQGWASQTVQSDVIFGANFLNYCTAGAARNTLINTYNWTISDDGLQCPNNVPSAISLSSNSIDENNATGDVIGSLSTTDADGGDTHTYTLVSGTGDADNGSFTISGNNLEAGEVFDFETKSSYSIRVQTDDGNGGTFQDEFTITINDVNEAPNSIALGSASIDENNAIGTVIGSFSTTDEDAGDTHTYSLVSGTGDADNGSFTISGNNLEAGEVFDFETKSSYSIRVQTDDGNGGTFQDEFTITINDVNEAPSSIDLSTASIDENNAIGAVIGSFSTTDVDAGDSHTYTLVSGTGDADNGSFTISGNNLEASEVFDFETKSSYSIRVQTDDGNGGAFQDEFTITINDVNEAPSSIALNTTSIDENNAAGAVIGSFSTTDVDAGDSHTYTLVSGTGDADNGSFDISGNNLEASEVFDFETKSSYSIRVQTDDGNGGTFQDEFTITINDVEEKQNQTITFAGLSDKEYGDASFSLTASSDSELAVSFEVVEGPVSLSGSEVTITGAGTATIRSMQAGNENFNPAEPVDQSFEITKAGLTVSAEDKTMTYGEALPALTYEITGLVYSDDESDLSTPVEISTAADQNSNAGTYAINVSGATAANYEVSFEAGSLTIEKAAQEITFDALSDVDIDQSTEVSLSATASSDLAVSFEVVSGPATVDGTTLSLSGTGTVTVRANQEGNENYQAAEPVSQSFDVFSTAKEDQSITFEGLPEKTFGDEAFELSATASSGLTVSYSSSDETVATIEGTTVTIVGTGTTSITASQAGNEEYNPAPAISQTLGVNKAAQEITIEAISNKDIEAADFEIVASTTSGLALSYEILSGPATLNGNIVTLSGEVGTVAIEVSQAGNENYLAAFATVSFEVVEDPCLGFEATATVIQNVSCNGEASGSFEVNPSSGTAPFTFTIGNDSQENGLFENMVAGSYEISVTDANGCSATATVEISEPDVIELTAETTDSNSIFGNGSISLTVTGGTGNYTYDWSNGETTANLSDLGIGEYTVTITDEAGCSITESYSIGGVTANREAFELNIYPNPVINQITISHGEKVKEISLMDANGKIILEQKASGKETLLEMTRLPAGMYFIRLDDGKMKRIIKE